MVYIYDAETFVRAWQRAADVDDVLRRLPGMQRRSAQSRATHLRKRGVPLQCFKGGPRPKIYAGLADLARESAS